jgi:hypothetical protein
MIGSRGKLGHLTGDSAASVYPWDRSVQVGGPCTRTRACRSEEASVVSSAGPALAAQIVLICLA